MNALFAYFSAPNHRPRLEAIAGKFQDKPLIGFVSTLLQDYVPLIDEYYYCEFLYCPPPLF